MSDSSISALSDVARIIQGGRLKLTGEHFVKRGFPAFGAGGVNGYLEQAEFHESAVVLSSIGARCGKCFLAEGKWTSLANTQLIFPNPTVADVRYLWYQLNDERRWHRSGSAQPFIKPSDVKSHRIYLPELSEQHRIAAMLDKADALRAKRRDAIAKLDQLLQSVFLDMFGDPTTNPRGWPEKCFGDMFGISSSKRVLESQWRREGVPFYRAREIVKLATNGSIDNGLFISEALFEELSSKGGAPQAGDLMVSAVGTLGACYQVQKGDRFYFKDASVLRFAPNEGTDSTFAQFAFGTEHVLRQVHSGSGSTVGTYTISRAKETRLFSPPLVIQEKFASFVRAVNAEKAGNSRSLELNNALFQSLQRNAFSSGI